MSFLSRKKDTTSQEVSKTTSAKSEVTPTGRVLDYTYQCWGHATPMIRKTDKEAPNGTPIYRSAIFAGGGFMGGIAVGDQITLKTEKGRVAQFLIIDVEWCRDPSDMYFIEFYPVKFVD